MKIIISILITLFSLSAIAQNESQILLEVQNAIKTRITNQSASTSTGSSTNFLIGMCVVESGLSQCNLDLARKNINNQASRFELWVLYLESTSYGQRLIKGMNGQMSDPDGLFPRDVRFRVIDNNNVVEEFTSNGNCVLTTHYRKISQSTIIENITNIGNGCSEDFKNMMREDLNVWSEPKKIYPIENRFPSVLNTALNTHTQTPPKIVNTPLLRDLFNYRWVERLAQCNAENSNYTLFNEKNGRYLVIGGKPQITANLPYVEIREISPNQVNMFLGIGARAKSEGLFDLALSLQINRKPDGSASVSEVSANLIDNNWQPLTKNVRFEAKPSVTTYYPCPQQTNPQAQSQPKAQTSKSTTFQKVKFKDGTTYEGETKDGAPQGKGVMIFPTGNKFVGLFDNGRKTQGTFTWENGEKFEGIYNKNGSKEKGTMTFLDGKKFQGTFDINTNVMNKGTLLFPNGNKYVGEFSSSQIPSNGIYYDSTGNIIFKFENGKKIEIPKK